MTPPDSSPNQPIMLLSPDDPAPVTLRNSASNGPAVITVDHAANAVPLRLDALGLPSRDFERHIAYDLGAQGVAEVLSDRLSVPMVAGGFSRLVIDLNRPPDDFTSIREIYDGAIIPGNRRLSQAESAARVDELFTPYHTAVATALSKQDAAHPHAAMIAVHSCTDDYAGFKRPWEIGVLSNRDRRMAERVLQRLGAHRPDLTIGDNKPYSGLDPYGYSVEPHALPVGRPNVLFEVRQDLITGEEGQRAFGELLALVLGEVLDDPSLFTPFPNRSSGG